MIEVSKEEFFRAIGGPENIHPRSEKTHSAWENLQTRELVGRTEPGYMRELGVKERYMLAPNFAAKKGYGVHQ